jgi:F-type H+-transporting ATPase subunit delta
MKDVTVARRYAKALFELASSEKSMNDVLQGLSNINLALKEAPELERVLVNPLIEPDAKGTIIREITSNKLILSFIDLLAKRKRLDVFREIYSVFRAMADDTNGVRRALIKTALPLSDAQKKSVENTLAQALKSNSVVGQFDVSPELIGGVWVKMGDQVLDASLRGRIDDFRSALLHSQN